MKILFQTDDELLFLAGDGRVSERQFSSVADFDLSGDLEKQIVRKVRGSHARPINRGNIKHRAFFRTRRMFPTAAEAELYVANAERSFPRSGTLYFVTGAGTRKLRDSVVKPPIPAVNGCEVKLQYQVAGGEFTPLEPELVFDGASGLLYRVVEDSGEKWFEVGFLSPEILSGSAADGWTDTLGNLLFRLHRSEDLITWDNDWIDCPTSPEASGDDWIIWGRSKYPVDSAIKTGLLQVSSGYSGSVGDMMSKDTRNNPFTALTILGVVRALGGFPYTMPGDAARMQTDLTAIFPGATVEASSNVVWRIRIPDITFSAYHQMNKVFWPGYYIADIFGGLTVLVDGATFDGGFVNAAGVRTSVKKQFARLGISAGPNYLY